MSKTNTVGQIKKSLAEYDGEDAFLAEHAKLLLAMPEDESLPILQAVTTLANSFHKMGALMAFEIIIKIGRKMAAQEALV